MVSVSLHFAFKTVCRTTLTLSYCVSNKEAGKFYSTVLVIYCLENINFLTGYIYLRIQLFNLE